MGRRLVSQGGPCFRQLRGVPAWAGDAARDPADDPDDAGLTDSGRNSISHHGGPVTAPGGGR